MKKKIACLLSGVMVLQLLLVGCGGGQSNTSESGGDAAQTETLRFGMTYEPISLDPTGASDNGSFMIMTQVYDTLVREDAEGNLVPGLAKSWTFSEDRTQIVFQLEEGVKFHNGETMTAEDVAYSLNEAAVSSYAAKITGTIDHAEATGDLEVTMTLKYPYEPILSCLSCANASIVCKSAKEADPEGFGRNPVGTGPFKFVSWENGQSITLERFDDYYRGPASIKDLTFRVYTDTNTAVIALESGDIDVLDNPPASDYENLRNNENLSLYETESSMPIFLGFNCESGPFSNQKLREAVSYALNRDDIILGSVEGYGVPLQCTIAPGAFGYPEDFQFNPYDPEKAKELLAEAGYPDGLTVSLKCNESTTYSKPAVIIQDQLRQIGIEVKVEIMEKGAFLEDIYTNGNFEMCVWAIISMIPDADYTMYSRFHSELMGGSNNFFRIAIPGMDDLLDASRVEGDPEVRADMFYQACELVREYVPLVPLYCGLNCVVANKNLEGVVANAANKYYVYDYRWVS